jgi:hypothetical protein
MSEQMYLIWSEEHGAWWRPGTVNQTWGYTHFMTEAGRYPKAAAEQIVERANKVIHPDTGLLRDRKFNEIAIPDPLSRWETGQ